MIRNIALALMVVLMMGLVGSGTACHRTLAPDGVYQGNMTLYNADKTINSSYKILHSFVLWEYQNRSILPADVSRAADGIRDNAEGLFQSAVNMREAYAKSAAPADASALEQAISVLQQALVEASNYMKAHGGTPPTS